MGDSLDRLEGEPQRGDFPSCASKDVAARRDEALSAMPEAQILMTLPGLGAVTCATFLSEVGDVSRFGSAAKLAAYTGLAPRSSIRPQNGALGFVHKKTPDHLWSGASCLVAGAGFEPTTSGL